MRMTDFDGEPCWMFSVQDITDRKRAEEALRALNDTLAAQVDRLGYERLWVAEHHGSTTFMASATSVILGDLAHHTSGIRLGLAPIEDLAWPVAAGLLLPSLWELLARPARVQRRDHRPSARPAGRRPPAAPGSATR